jgi:hypothetical protein
MEHTKFLIVLADNLDEAGEYELADMVDENFKEFLDLLESGKLTFNPQFSGGSRDPRGPYSNRGVGPITISDVPGPQ